MNLFEGTPYEYSMSCRVAAKHIESAFMQWLVNNYACKEIRFCGINSMKNGLLIRTLHGFGLDNIADDPNRLLLTIHVNHMDWPEIVEVVDHRTSNT